jgi:hypothetical protein
MDYGINSILKNENKQLGSSDNRVGIEGIGSLVYYPNTRSSLNLSLSARYGNKATGEYYGPYLNVSSFDYFNPYPDIIYYPAVYPNLLFVNSIYGFNYANEYNYWLTRMTLRHYYYINPQFRVQSNFTISYTDDDVFLNFNNNNIDVNFGISFSYAFF